MENSDSVNAISNEWEKLLEDSPAMTKYILDALMLTPSDTKKRVVNGKSNKIVQLYSIQNSISNNASPEKKGLTYLAMRSIHYWKTTYERAIQNPEEIEERKGKYITRHRYDSLLDDYHAEISKLEDQMYSKNTVPKEQHQSVEDECNEWRRKYEKLDNDYNKNMEASVNAERKYAQQDVIVLEKKIKFMEEELKKSFANNSAKQQ